MNIKIPLFDEFKQLSLMDRLTVSLILALYCLTIALVIYKVAQGVSFVFYIVP